jgi:hypothetical protein
MDLLAVLLWTAAAGGVLAAVVATVQPRKRRGALLLAALLFLPIGILGILSIGAVFLLASAVCLIAAVSSRARVNGTRTQPS